MVGYEGIVKRSIDKSPNGTLYSVLSDENGEKCFVKLYSVEEFGKIRKHCEVLCERFLNCVDSIAICSDPEDIINLNVKVLHLTETLEFMKIHDPNNEIMGKALSKIQKLQGNVDIITSAFAEVAKDKPRLTHSYKPRLFEVPGVVEKIVEGKEEFTDKDGRVLHETNDSAYESLLVRKMLLGNDKFSVNELIRVENGKDWNKRLEEEFNEKEIDRK